MNWALVGDGDSIVNINPMVLGSRLPCSPINLIKISGLLEYANPAHLPVGRGKPVVSRSDPMYAPFAQCYGQS